MTEDMIDRVKPGWRVDVYSSGINCPRTYRVVDPKTGHVWTFDSHADYMRWRYSPQQMWVAHTIEARERLPWWRRLRRRAVPDAR